FLRPRGEPIPPDIWLVPVDRVILSRPAGLKSLRDHVGQQLAVRHHANNQLTQWRGRPALLRYGSPRRFRPFLLLMFPNSVAKTGQGGGFLNHRGRGHGVPLGKREASGRNPRGGVTVTVSVSELPNRSGHMPVG